VADQGPCTRPGCTGTLEDGYCNLCGLAAPKTATGSTAAGSAPHPGASAAGSAPQASATGDPAHGPCTRPGCTGTLEDGYCNECGLAAPKNTTGASVSNPAPQSTGPTPASQASTPSGTAGTGSSRRGSGRTGSGRSGRTGTTGPSRRGALGAGLVDVPPVPYRDPSTAIMDNPQVKESKRYCSKCGEPVGRGRDGTPGRTEGFCRKCGTAFSFAPKLKKDDLIAGQYEVLGCLAHGGLGWIYLARDRNVSNRWVVLKGLLDSGDADALAAAVAERQFLATVEHPNIVKIYNFVQHPDPRTGAMTGYIVMEYVGGQSLKEIALERRKTGESLPLPQVLAYGIEVLRAFGYLHSKGLIYCDFKPDNVIQTEEQLRLIDLGGVIAVDDEDSAVYGTVGYQAPEIATEGPSISSDLYTVARTLAVLSFDFKGYTNTFKTSLPARKDIQVLAQYESFDRLLRRATDPDFTRRYWSAEDMADQLIGVLREVLAAGDGRARSAHSSLFGPEVHTFGSDFAAARTTTLDAAAMAGALPIPKVDDADPAAGFLAGIQGSASRQIIDALSNPPVNTIEVRLRLARALIELGDVAEAGALLDGLTHTLLESGEDDWRVTWYRALTKLAAGDAQAAQPLFDDIYSLVPGELAPKLALACCAELTGDRARADYLYGTVWRTNTTYISAAFGLARVRLSAGDRNGAVKALESVPSTSSHYVAAQISAVAARVRDRPAADLNHDDLVAAATRLESLGLAGESGEKFTIEVLEAALGWLVDGTGKTTANANSAQLLGMRLTERDVRFGLERSYRALARIAGERTERISLVDRANAVRPRTLT
jgi:serine/threonine-protein kinase PknG